MSRRLDVLTALTTLIAAALPNAEVLGLVDDASPPMRIYPGGRVVVRSGDPGEPEVDLCPLSYNYFHRIPVEVLAPNEETLDVMLMAIGGAIELDRTLGGLCDWVEPAAAETDEIVADNAVAQRGADLNIIANYATPNPLT